MCKLGSRDIEETHVSQISFVFVRQLTLGIPSEDPVPKKTILLLTFVYFISEIS